MGLEEEDWQERGKRWLERSTGTRPEGACNPPTKLGFYSVGCKPKEGCEQKSIVVRLEGWKEQVGW